MTRRRVSPLGLVLGLVLAAPLAAKEPGAIFAERCAPCHGKEGRPSALFTRQGVPDLTVPAWQKALSDAQIAKTIREGKKGTMMAAFENQLSAEEMKGLVAYIRKLGGKK
jgi:cytochrome c6